MAQNQSILDIAHYANAQVAVNTSSTSVTNSDGTTTITTNTTVAAFSAKDGDLNRFLGAATQTSTQVVGGEGNWATAPPQYGPAKSISLADAAKVISPSALQRASSAQADMAYHFVRAQGSDIYHHPFTYAMHAAGFALPFLKVPQAVEGILVGVEALITASDLQKQAGNQ